MPQLDVYFSCLKCAMDVHCFVVVCCILCLEVCLWMKQTNKIMSMHVIFYKQDVFILHMKFFIILYSGGNVLS
jgi:hypothetical protein